MTEKGDQLPQSQISLEASFSPKPIASSRTGKHNMSQQEYMLQHLMVMREIRDELRQLNQTIGQRVVFNVTDVDGMVLMQEESAMNESATMNENGSL